MYLDHIRKLYDYHFAVNRKLWDQCVMALTDEQFKQKVDYGLGSVRNHVVHMMSVDEGWFAPLRGLQKPPFLNPVHYPKREKIRAYWDRVEGEMRATLATLDEARLNKPYPETPFAVGQVLAHVANHGTDHRAQLLRIIHDFGVPTFAQDYFFFLIDRL